MADILQTNLASISQYNSALGSKISEIKELTKTFDINTNLVGEYNLLIAGIPVHSLTGAQQEAKEITDCAKYNDFGTVHVIYGIGLGYLVDESISNLKGKVIVYEPDIEALYFVLSAVDFSQNLKTQRLFFASTREEFSAIFRKIFRYKTKTTLSYLDYHKTHCADLSLFAEWLKREAQLIEHNYSFQVNNTFKFFLSTLQNLAAKYKLKSLADYKDIFKDKPAVIVSAGPSLNKNIETLKKYHDNAIIFCVGTALRTLYNNGITPDFLNVIEKVNTSQHYNLPFTKDICFIGEQFTESSYLNIPFKERFLTNSLENDDSRWFLEKAGKDFVNFETKGTVAYHAIFSAYYLGCNPIILVGQDLAYPDGQCYSKGSKFDGLKCVFDKELNKFKIEAENYDEYRHAYCESENHSIEIQDKIVKKKLEDLNKNLVTVKGQNGELLPTDAVYSLFIDYLQDFSKRYGSRRTLLNASVGGAKIEGFEVVSLENVFNQYASAAIDKESLFKKFANQRSFNISVVRSSLAEDLEVVNTLLKLIEPMISVADGLEKEIEGCKTLNSKIYKSLEKLSNLYVKITNNYMLKYRIIKMIAVLNYNAIAYLSREYPEINDYSVAVRFANAYIHYVRRVKNVAAMTADLLNKAINELENEDESCAAKS